MKLDTSTLIQLVNRKGLSWVGAIVLGMVICAEDDQTRDIVRKYVGLLTSGGGGALVLSVVLSMLNDSKKAQAIEEVKELKVEANENLYKAPDGYMLVKAKAEPAEMLK